MLPVTAPARALIAARSGSKALVPSAVPAPMLVRKPKKSAKTPIKFVMESVRFSRKGRQESLALSMKNISDNEMIPSDLKSVVDESKGIVDQYVPDGHSCRCYGMFASTRLALIRWWTALRQENELVSFFDCAAWVTKNAKICSKCCKTFENKKTKKKGKINVVCINCIIHFWENLEKL